MGIFSNFKRHRMIKKIAQQYGGDPADYERMVKNVQSSLEKVAEKLNAAGIPSIMWQNALDDIIDGSELGKVFSGGDTPALGGDMNELRDEAIWFVDKMLKQYSDQWKQDDQPEHEQLADQLMQPFHQHNMPAASPEDIEQGAYVPGVDYSMIEKLLLSWTNEIDPMLAAATDKYIQDVAANMGRQVDDMNALIEELRKHPNGEKGIEEIMSSMHSAMQNEYGYDKDFKPMLRQLQAKNIPMVMTAMHMAGYLDPYNFSYRNSSIADDFRDRIDLE